MSTSAAALAPLKLAKLQGIEEAKRAAAYAAVDNHVRPEHAIIGIGSGGVRFGTEAGADGASDRSAICSVDC